MTFETVRDTLAEQFEIDPSAFCEINDTNSGFIAPEML